MNQKTFIMREVRDLHRLQQREPKECSKKMDMLDSLFFIDASHISLKGN